jgi:hypothetical protein
MFDVPEHLTIPVNKYGQGPLEDGDPTFDHYSCWCSSGDNCKEFKK